MTNDAASTKKRTLTDAELDCLDLAGSWRMLRDLSGLKVCMTGKMSMQRAQLARLVEAAGGVFTNTMSGSVNILVVADDSVWSTKIEQAEERGTRVLRETEFAAELLPTPAELLGGMRAKFGADR